MNFKIALVLKHSNYYQGRNLGSKYGPKHANFLINQLLSSGVPEESIVCLSDLPRHAGIHCQVQLLQYPNFHTWWSKMELFNPKGDTFDDNVLFMDLDTVVVKNLKPLLDKVETLSKFTALNDWYNPDKSINSSILYIPKGIKTYIWDYWMGDNEWNFTVDDWIPRFTPPTGWGDQEFLTHALKQLEIPINYWQSILPDFFVSYKSLVACKGMPGYHDRRSKGNGTIPTEAHVVCFHGNPRPWDVELPWVPKL